MAAEWQWDNSDPFGNNAPNENPTNQGTFHFDLRFPGQVFDQETNTHYNINRDYDPATGRYIQSDPIGLAGGSYSTYGYVDNNPLGGVDPEGLFNYAKGAVALGNLIIAGVNISAGAASIVGGAGVAPTGVGVPVSVGAIAFGAFRINAGIAAARRAKQQFDEAKKECPSDASLNNLLGLLPFGQNFDDPQESFSGYVQGLLNQPASIKIINILIYGPFGQQ
jgi:RHS repeat-associated protein